MRISSADWSYPLFAVNSKTATLRNVQSTHWGGNIFDAWDTDKNNYIDEPAPLPAGVYTENSVDGHISIVDPFRMLIWDYSTFSVSNWTTSTYNIWDITGTGVAVPLEGNRPNSRGGRGAGFNSASGNIRPEEVQADMIRHASVFQFTYNRKGDDNKVWFVAPAARSDGQHFGENFPLEGVRLQLNPALSDADFNAWGLGESAKRVARSLQVYGMYLGDNGGNFSIYRQRLSNNSTTSDNLWNTAAPGMFADMQKIPSSAFRVLEPGHVYKFQ